MDNDRVRKLARLAMLALIASACDEPAKSPNDADGGAVSTPHVERTGNTDKSHCGGDGK